MNMVEKESGMCAIVAAVKSGSQRCLELLLNSGTVFCLCIHIVRQCIILFCIPANYFLIKGKQRYTCFE